MRHLLLDPFSAGYLRRALLELLLLGVLGAVVGVQVLLRRHAFMTEVVQHTVFPGIAIAFAAGQSLLLGALVSGLVSVLLVRAGERRRVDSDALMALVIAVFFSVGVVVVSRRRGFQSDLTSLLVGRILTVDHRQLIDTAVVGAACVLAVWFARKELMLRAFDPVGAAALGYPVRRLDLLLDVVVTLTVVVAVRAVGTVLVVAFIVTPAATARLVSHRVGTMTALAVSIGTAAGVVGLLVSYHGSIDHGWRLASGATVVALMTALFLLVAGGRAVARKVGPRRGRRSRSLVTAALVPGPGPAVGSVVTP